MSQGSRAPPSLSAFPVKTRKQGRIHMVGAPAAPPTHHQITKIPSIILIPLTFSSCVFLPTCLAWSWRTPRLPSRRPPGSLGPLEFMFYLFWVIWSGLCPVGGPPLWSHGRLSLTSLPIDLVYIGDNGRRTFAHSIIEMCPNREALVVDTASTVEEGRTTPGRGQGSGAKVHLQHSFTRTRRHPALGPSQAE